MGIVRLLYQLQEIDLDIEAKEPVLKEKVSQLGESPALIETQGKLNSAQQRLEELKRQQRSTEWEVEDLTAKIKAMEEQLYSGRIRNPKELANLQHEVQILKTKCDQRETGLLEIMDEVERAENSVNEVREEFKRVQAEWQSQQQKLSAEIETIKSQLAALKQKRQALAVEVDAPMLERYGRLKRQKGQAIVKVEQGICGGCRISLPSSELQQARGGNLVHCGSCGRILFLP